MMEAEDLDRHLAGIRARDEQAFGQWMTAAEGRLRAALRSFAAHVDVEAVMQETFLQVWQIGPRFEPDGRPNSLLRFSFRCARNLAISAVRRRRAGDVDDVERALAQAGDVTDPVQPDPALRRILADCATRLPPKPRAALAARIAGGGAEPDRVLADRLDMRLNTFLQNVTRARRLLLECLEKAGVELEQSFA